MDQTKAILKRTVRKIEFFKIPIRVTQTDIDETKCRNRNSCMVKIAVERKLRELDPSMPNHHTRVDGGHLWFNFEGHHCIADMPLRVKSSLIQFDAEEKARRKATREGKPFASKVKPFEFILVAARKTKIKKNSDERRTQINTARTKRIEAGEKPKRYTLRARIVGFA